MLVIVGGIAKSGTNWMRHMVNDLVIATGGSDVSELRDNTRYLNDILIKSVNRIGHFTFKRAVYLSWLSIFQNNFCVYYMGPPSLWLKLLLKFNFAKMIFTFRDPRDVVLSVMDHGSKAIKLGENNHHFANYVELDPAIGYVNREFSHKISWLLVTKNVVHLKYEDNLNDTKGALVKIARFLSLKCYDSTIQLIADKYSEKDFDPLKADHLHLHLNKAKSQRFSKEFNPDSLNKVNVALEHHIEIAGYR